MRISGIRFMPVFIAILAISAVILTSCGDDSSTTGSSSALPKLRVLHLSQANAAVDVEVDDSVIVNGLTYGEASPYREYSPGSRIIKVTPSALDTPVYLEDSIDLETDLEYTVFLINNAGAVEEIHSADDRTTIVDQAKIRFVHAIPDGAAYDIKFDSGFGGAVTQFGNVGFHDITDYHQINGTDYGIVVSPTGVIDTLLAYDPITIENEKVYTIVAYGTVDAGDTWPINIRVFEDGGDGTSYIEPVKAP